MYVTRASETDWRIDSRSIAKQLIELEPFSDDNLDEIRLNLEYDFRVIADDPDVDEFAFGLLMGDLYEWAETVELTIKKSI